MVRKYTKVAYFDVNRRLLLLLVLPTWVFNVQNTIV